MSGRHTDAVLGITFRGGLATKCVALVMAGHACRDCGFAWPGVPTIARESQLGTTKSRECLDELVTDGWLRVYAYASGGRRKTTEYIVLPGLAVTHTPPCSNCLARQKNWTPAGKPNAQAVGLTSPIPNAQAVGLEKPTAKHPQYPPPSVSNVTGVTAMRGNGLDDETSRVSDEQPSVDNITVNARGHAHSEERAASRPAELFDTPPDPEKRRKAEKFMRDIGATPPPVK